MSGFADPPFILFSGLVWFSTFIWTYIITKVLIRRRVPFQSGSESRNFLESSFQLSIIPSVVIWLYYAPQVAGYGIVFITLEGIVGLAISAIISFFTIGFMVQENHFQFPDEETSETKGYYDC